MAELDSRAAREIAHGQLLARGNAEEIWGWTTPGGQIRFRRRGEVVVVGARMAPGQRVLELGCGTGLFTEVFARTGAEITAVDISPQLIERARRRMHGWSNVRLVLGPFETAPLDPPFDAIVGSSVLHHLDIAPSLRRIFELLKPRGLMCFAEPNLLNPQVFLERRFRNWPPFRSYTSPDETAFVRFSFTGVLRRAGFDEIQLTPFDWVHPYTPARFLRVVQHIGRVLESTPVVREFAGSLLIRGCRP